MCHDSRRLFIGLLALLIFSGHSFASSCSVFNEKFDGTASYQWSYNLESEWSLNQDKLLTSPVSDNNWAIAETSIHPPEAFFIDVDINVTSNNTSKGLVALYPFTTGDFYFSIDNRSVDGVAVVVDPVNKKMQFMVWNFDAGEWNTTDEYAFSDSLQSIGLKYTDTAVIFRINRQDSTLKLTGTFTLSSVIDQFWLMASGSGFQSSFDNLCADINSADNPAAPANPSTPEPVIPQAPENLIYSLVNDILNISWDSVTGADGYRLLLGLQSGSYPYEVDMQNNQSLGPLNTSAVPAGTYYFAATAYNNAGSSGLSNEIVVTLTEKALGYPANLSHLLHDNMLNLNWDAVPEATGYQLHMGINTPGSYPYVLDLGPALKLGPLDISSLEPATYYFAVSAYNNSKESALSGSVSVTLGESTVEDSAAEILITSVSADYLGTLMQGLIIPGQNAWVDVFNLKSSNLSLIIETSNGPATIQPDQVSVSDGQIIFTAPVDTVSGDLKISIDGKEQGITSYRAVTTSEPLITRLVPDVIQANQQLTIQGVNLSAENAQVTLINGNRRLSIPAAGTAQSISLTLPDDAFSGEVWVQIGEKRSNSLPLEVKRNIKVNVTLPDNLTLDNGRILVGRGENLQPLDNNYSSNLTIKHGRADFIAAIAEYSSGNSGLLYEAVALPDDVSITLTPLSTAIKMVFFGAGYQLSPQENHPAILSAIQSDSSVKALADYIVQLQSGNVQGWINFDDATLLQKLTDALTSTSGKIASLASQNRVNSTKPSVKEQYGIKVIQDQENNAIQVQPAEHGKINLYNDTRLHLSIQATSKRDGSIVGKYRHIRHLFDGGRVFGQQSSLLHLAAEEQSEFYEDVNIEIVTGAILQTYTDKDNVRAILLGRELIMGIMIPLIDSMLTELFNSTITDNAVDTAVDIAKSVGLSSIPDFIDKAGSISEKTGFAALEQYLIVNFEVALNDCAKIIDGGGATCKNLLLALGKAAGLDPATLTESFVKKLGIEQAKKLIPGVGTVKAAFRALTHTANAFSVGGTLYDVTHNPQEINADIDFLLEVNKVEPFCLGLQKDHQRTNAVFIDGYYFSCQQDQCPEVYIGNVKSDTVTINSETKLDAYFNTSELIAQRSGDFSVQVEHMGLKAGLDGSMRVISPDDEEIFLDGVTPDKGVTGETVQLYGCGFLPGNDVRVLFTTKDHVAEGKISFVSPSIIRVTIPTDAVSGKIYVRTSNKAAEIAFEIPLAEATRWSSFPNPEYCPMSDQGSSKIDIADKNNDGKFEDYAVCFYSSSNGMLFSESIYQNNKLHGIKKEYSNGSLTKSMPYIEGKKEGVGMSYENNVVVVKTPYVNDLKNGTGVSYWSNGNIASKADYKDDEKHGWYRRYYDTGLIKSETYYVKGVKNGIEKEYDESGNLTSVQIFKNGNVDGESQVTNATGDFEVVQYVNGIKHGLTQTFNDQGVLIAEVPYNNGKIDGVVNYYFSNGILHTSYTYANDIKNGVSKQYLESGELHKEYTFTNNEITRACGYYYPDDKTREWVCHDV